MIHFTDDYPWIQLPLIAGAPMRLIALSSLASAVSNAGGIGFIGAGNDVSQLANELDKAQQLLKVKGNHGQMPIGVGFLLWAGDKLLEAALPIIEKYKPAAVWLFAPNDSADYAKWAQGVRKASQGLTKIWVQVGTVEDVRRVEESCEPDVIVVQGSDAGGHGLTQNASIISLLPEVDDAVTSMSGAKNLPKPVLIAAGGIMDGRGTAAAMTLGAMGVVLGTRLLLTYEANIADGYRNAVTGASDGGVTTARGKLYDSLRGTTDWPEHYGGRGVLNHSWRDHLDGMTFEDNKALYDRALKQEVEDWGPNGRLTTYAGTGVGLVDKTDSAEAVVRSVRSSALQIIQRTGKSFAMS